MFTYMSVPRWNPPDSLSCAITGRSWHLAFDLPRAGWTRGSTEENDESDGKAEAISGRQVTKKLWAGEEWPTEYAKVVESSRLLAAAAAPHFALSLAKEELEDQNKFFPLLLTRLERITSSATWGSIALWKVIGQLQVTACNTIFYLFHPLPFQSRQKTY